MSYNQPNDSRDFIMGLEGIQATEEYFFKKWHDWVQIEKNQNMGNATKDLSIPTINNEGVGWNFR